MKNAPSNKNAKLSRSHLLPPDELHGLLERVAGVAAGVEHEGAKVDVRKKTGVAVDLVQREHHRLHALQKRERALYVYQKGWRFRVLAFPRRCR